MENFIQLSLNELQINRFIVIGDFYMKYINCANTDYLVRDWGGGRAEAKSYDGRVMSHAARMPCAFTAFCRRPP
jgi:hypothetical protein